MQFRGRYYFLSNFYPCSIEIDGVRYESAEAAFQGQKSRQHAHMFAGHITALEAKRLGRRIPINIREWNARRLDAMRRVVRAKFEQNPQLQEMLLTLGGQVTHLALIPDSVTAAHRALIPGI